MTEKQSHIPDADGNPQEYPTTDKPLNGPRRGRALPIVLVILFVAALVFLAWFGAEVLVGAD